MKYHIFKRVFSCTNVLVDAIEKSANSKASRESVDIVHKELQADSIVNVDAIHAEFTKFNKKFKHSACYVIFPQEFFCQKIQEQIDQDDQKYLNIWQNKVISCDLARIIWHILAKTTVTLTIRDW